MLVFSSPHYKKSKPPLNARLEVTAVPLSQFGIPRVESRWSPRRPMHYTAWVYSADRSRLYECVVSDVSAGGARLTLAAPTDISDEFTLLLRKDGAARRHCRVIWRSNKHIGLQFLIASQESPDASIRAAP
jgi:hypothetical protein